MSDAEQRLNTLKTYMEHQREMFSLQTTRIEAIGAYNKAIAEAWVKIAEAQGKFIDNAQKVWRWRQLQQLKHRVQSDIRDSLLTLRRKERNLREAIRLQEGDRTTQDVGRAWRSFGVVLRNSPPAVKAEVYALPFQNEYRDRRHYRLLQRRGSNRTIIPYYSIQDANSLPSLAHCLQYYQFATIYGSSPHLYVLEGLEVVSRVAEADLIAERAKAEQEEAEYRELLASLGRDDPPGELKEVA